MFLQLTIKTLCVSGVKKYGLILTFVWTKTAGTLNSNSISDSRWHLGHFPPKMYCLYTDYLMLHRSGIHAFTQQFQLYTLIIGAELGQTRHNLVWLCSIMSLHRVLSRHRAALTLLRKIPFKIFKDFYDYTFDKTQFKNF